jgi:hypothetical protein
MGAVIHSTILLAPRVFLDHAGDAALKLVWSSCCDSRPSLMRANACQHHCELPHELCREMSCRA